MLNFQQLSVNINERYFVSEELKYQVLNFLINGRKKQEFEKFLKKQHFLNNSIVTLFNFINLHIFGKISNYIL